MPETAAQDIWRELTGEGMPTSDPFAREEARAVWQETAQEAATATPAQDIWRELTTETAEPRKVAPKEQRAAQDIWKELTEPAPEERPVVTAVRQAIAPQEAEKERIRKQRAAQLHARGRMQREGIPEAPSFAEELGAAGAWRGPTRLATTALVKPVSAIAQLEADYMLKPMAKGLQFVFGDNWISKVIDQTAENFREPFQIETALEEDFQERLNSKLQRGDTKGVAAQVITEGGLDVMTGLLQMMMMGGLIKGTAPNQASFRVLGKQTLAQLGVKPGAALAIPGLEAGGAKAVLGNAVLRGVYSFLTTRGNSADRLRAGMSTTAFMSTPIAARFVKYVPVLADLGLNTMLSVVTGAYPDAWRQAQQQAKVSGKPEDTTKLFLANALPTFISDVIASSGTRYEPSTRKALSTLRGKVPEADIARLGAALKAQIPTCLRQQVEPEPADRKLNPFVAHEMRTTSLAHTASDVHRLLKQNGGFNVDAPKRTAKQSKKLHAMERKLELSKDMAQTLRRAFTRGRTITTKDFTIGEASAYIDYLGKYGNQVKYAKTMPTMAKVDAELPSALDIDKETHPTLYRFAQDVTVQMERTARPSEEISFGGKGGRAAAIWDIDRTMYDAEEQTGFPIGRKHNAVRKVHRDIMYDSGRIVKNLFMGTDLTAERLHRDEAACSRIFQYQITGTPPPDLRPAERIVADRMNEYFESQETLVKRERHQRYIRTGELPAGNKTQMRALMEDGKRVLEEQGAEAYDKWLDDAAFGVRENYAPTRRKRGMANIGQILKRGFGRGFTKTRTVERPEYDPDNPLLGAFYRYVTKTQSIQRLEPHLDDLKAMLNEANIQEGIVGRYFDNMYGVHKELGPVQAAWTTGMRQFFRVRIPQALARWYGRNRLQNTAFTLPKVFSPRDPLFWRNLPKMYSAWRRYGSTSKIISQMFPDPEVREFAARYMTSLDAARQHYLFQDLQEWAPMRGFMGFMDRMSKGYSFSDTQNRLEAFLYGYDTGRQALDRFNKNPSEKNWQRFLKLTGAVFAPRPEQLELARLASEGDNKAAALMAAERLSNSTNFRYPRSERGLAWQEVGTGGNLVTPIATFAKGVVQDVYKDGIRPVMDGLDARAKGKATSYTDQKMYAGASHIAGWYAASLVVNQIMETVYDIDEGSYGLSILRYTPGGPIAQRYAEAAQSIWTTFGEGGSGGYKMAATADKLGDAFLPFYHLITRMTAEAKGRDPKRFGLMREGRRLIRNWLADMSGSKRPADQRRWVEHNTLEMVQAVLFDGAWSTKKRDLVNAYARFSHERDPDKRQRRYKELEEMIRKYPVSTKRKHLPRTPGALPALVPGLEVPQ